MFIICFLRSMCVLGKRLIQMNDTRDCTKAFLRPYYCANDSQLSCDPYYMKHNVSVVKGIRGITSGVLRGAYYLALRRIKLYGWWLIARV